MDQRSQWRFDMADDGWYWTVERADGSKSASAQRWPTLKQCADDAAANGYVVWKPEEERRRDQILQVTDALKRQE